MRTRTRIQAIATTLVLGVSLITFTIRACSSIHVATDLAVVDGDTVEVTVDGVRERVRLLGIDTPERGRCGAEKPPQDSRTSSHPVRSRSCKIPLLMPGIGTAASSATSRSTEPTSAKP